MNEALKAMHMQTITEENAVKIYDALCEACEMREGGMTDPDQMLVADIARAEQIKQALIADVNERGIGSERSNGRQKYWQGKHLSELRLTPNSRKAAPVMVDDEFATF